jgi:hypothetical protein
MNKYLAYLNNNFIFAGFIGLLCALLSYAESKRTKEKYSLKTYLKIFLLGAVMSFVVVYLKTKVLNNVPVMKFPVQPPKTSVSSGGSVNVDNYSNVNIGEPDF